MIRAQVFEAAKPHRQPVANEQFEGAVTTFYEKLGQTPPEPQAFLVEQSGGFTLRAHFHPQHQFQLVAAGDGLIGRHKLAPFALHYTSPESGYGPIVSGPDGLSYFTLRAVTSKGAHYLPESRSEMKPGLEKRQVTIDPPAVSHSAALRSRSTPITETLIEPQADGLAAWLLRVPPQGEVHAPAVPGGGRFYVVAAGAMLSGGERYTRLSPVFVSAGERSFAASADEEGLEVMVLQFPVQAVPAQ